MTVNMVRAVIALMIVGVFMFITGFMAIFPLITEAKVGLGEYADFFAKTASVYTGIIGVIVGYYFARTEDKRARPPGEGTATPGGAPGPAPNPPPQI